MTAISLPAAQNTSIKNVANNDILVQICIDEELGRLDREVDATYRRLRDSLEGECREALMEDQREWLSRRDQKCRDYKQGLECLLDLYRERLRTLEAPGQSR